MAEAETTALIGAMSVAPDTAHASAIDGLVVALKSAGIWSKLDGLWVFAAHHEQASRLNWINPGGTAATAVNSPTFTADAGWKGDGSTSYLNTGWIASAGVNFAQNSASWGTWISAGVGNDTATGTVIIMGANNHRLEPRYTGDTVRGRLNSAGSTTFGSGVTTRAGLTAFSRTASNLTTAYRNGASIGTTALASSTRSANAMFILAANASGSPTDLSNNQVRMAFVSAGLNATENADFYNALVAYFAAIVAGPTAITGSASITLGALTVSATGTLAITGSASVTLGALTTVSAAKLPITGTGGSQLGALTTTASGKLSITGAANITLGALQSTGSGVLPIDGEAGLTLGALTVSATGKLAITGAASITLGELTTISAGEIVAPGGGSANITLGELTVTATGVLPIAGYASITLGEMTLVSTGTVAAAPTGVPRLSIALSARTHRHREVPPRGPRQFSVPAKRRSFAVTKRIVVQ